MCSRLPAPSNGRIDQQGNRPGDRAQYSCNVNYELSGDRVRTCQDDGSWSGSSPTCTRFVCSNLPNPNNGQVTFSSGVVVGSRATYTCNTGYFIVGESTRTCQQDGTWSGSVPTCTIIRCGGLSNPSNGQVSIIDNTVGGIASYTCTTGYTLVGSETRICQSDGSWSESAPDCRIIRCGGLSNPSNGRVSITNDIPGGVASYTCNSGYTLVGRDTRTCQDDGSWSGISPICRRVRCNVLPSISNGEVQFSSDIIFPGSTATYNCIAGYRLVGEATRTCQESGQWSGQVPFCRCEFIILNLSYLKLLTVR